MKITTRSFGWLFCVYAVHGFFYLLAVNDRLATPQSANADSSPKRGQGRVALPCTRPKSLPRSAAPTRAAKRRRGSE